MSTQSGWQLTGNAPDAYQRYIVEAVMLGWWRGLVDAAGVENGQRVLDVACGTGVVASIAALDAGLDGRVVGLDMNAGMLAKAQQVHQASGGSHINWQEGNAAALPFPDASFDVVLCQQGIQFFPDKAGSLGEMCRVLAPGGCLAVSIWRGLEFAPWQLAVADALERHVGPEAANGIRGAFALGDGEELRAVVAGAGFREVRLRTESQMIRYRSLAEFVPGYLSATPVASTVAGLDAGVQGAILQDVTDALRPHMDGGGLAAPIEAHVVLALA